MLIVAHKVKKKEDEKNENIQFDDSNNNNSIFLKDSMVTFLLDC
jgi:hypothetical protein